VVISLFKTRENFVWIDGSWGLNSSDGVSRLGLGLETHFFELRQWCHT